ncbi:MAG: hypothetical protein P8I13_07735, partial [Porticoccaceae bacterium]|nr:hypothetical protein [Porticoccaceae bacterium]
MHKGFCTVLGLLFFSLLTACNDDVEKPAPVPPPPPSEITVTGQIMLGPVMPGNSLEVEALDKDNKSLGTSPVSSDGSYGINLKDHNGLVIVRVYSNTPKNQCSGSGDYIDEATAEPACFGTRTLLSTSAVNKGTDSSNGKLEVHSTPLTTMAAFHVGLDVDAQGELFVPSNLSKEQVESSNKVIAQALGLGDKPITEIKPTSLITSEKQFKQGDAYANALAIISGAEADNTNQLPNDLLRQISKGITTVNNNPKLDQSTQDLMVKGLQKVSDKIKQKTTNKTIIDAIISDLDKAQVNFPDSNHTANLIKKLPKPQFTNRNKTSNVQAVWQWKSHKLGSGNFKYKFADDTEWIETKDTEFVSTTPLKLGSHTLEIRESD